MSSGVAEIEHIDLTAVFTYGTMSYVAATTLTQKLNSSISASMSYDVVRSVNTDLVDDSKIHIV